MMLARREVMMSALAAASAPRLPHPAPTLNLTLLGQSLIQEDLCRSGWSGFAELRSRLRHADVVFTDLETAIGGAPGLDPTRAGEVLHAAPPAVLDCLKALGVTLVTTANNHAWDLGTAGVLHALGELDRRGLAHAGSGRDLSQASAPARVVTPRGSVALVAAAAGAIRDGAAATPQRAGVNELRRARDGALVEEDVARLLAAVRLARRQAPTVIVCLHNHYWEADPSQTPPWQRSLARAVVDAGASVFVGHGPPMLQGIELYRGAPILHGLGNFIFQTRKTRDAYGLPTWQSVIAELEVRSGHVVSVRLVPIVLDQSRPPGDQFTRGTPSLAGGEASRQIFARLMEMSAPELLVDHGGYVSISLG